MYRCMDKISFRTLLYSNFRSFYIFATFHYDWKWESLNSMKIVTVKHLCSTAFGCSPFYFNTTIDYKSIQRCINIFKHRTGERTCIDPVKPCLPGIQKILKIDVQGKMFP